MRVTITVNGERREADDVWEGESLLYVLRERLGLPGSKNACEQGECGSCTVYLDGVTCCACLVAAGQADGREVVTVEGLAASTGGRAAPGAAGVRRRRRRAVRLLHARAAGRDPRPAGPRPRPRRRRDPRGARRQPVPLHRLREDHRGRAPGRGGGCDDRRDRGLRGRDDGRATGTEHATGHVVVEGAPDHRGRGRAGAPRPAGRRRTSTAPAAWRPRGWSTPTTTSTSGLTRGFASRPHALRVADRRSTPSGRASTRSCVRAGATGALVQLARTGCTTTTDHHYVFPARRRRPARPPRSRPPARSGCASCPTRGSMDLGASRGGLPPDRVVEEIDAILAADVGRDRPPPRPVARLDAAHRRSRPARRSRSPASC